MTKKRRRYRCHQCGQRHTEKFMDLERPGFCWRCAEHQRDIETECHFIELPDNWRDQLWRREEARNW